MAGAIFTDIDPGNTSGTQLAAILNSFKDYIASGGSGIARDAELQAYGTWWDTTTVVADSLIKWKSYNGTVDKTILTLNKDSGTIIFADIADSFSIKRNADDSVGPILKLIKKRIAGGGQSLENDVLGEIDFKGTDASAVEYIQAKIYSISTDDTTAAAQGADLVFDITPDNTASLIEKMRLKGDGKLGIGTASPEKLLHVVGSTDAAEIKVTRDQDVAAAPIISTRKKNGATDLGQTKSANIIGQYIMKGTDETGAEVDLMKIESVAGQDITAADNGNSVALYHKQAGSNTFSKFLEVDKDGNVNVVGLQQTEVQSSSVLLDDTATRNLFTIDGATYGSFTAEAHIWGRNAVGDDKRYQHSIIKGIYDGDAGTWVVNDETEVTSGISEICTFSLTDATIFTVDYINQIASGVFNQGKIYLTIRRNLL